jgi:nucleoid DNA-binding protein
MTKSEMVKKLAQSWGGISNRQANDNLTALVDFVGKTVKKEKALKIPSNPQTGEPINIPARKKVGFTPAKVFKESVLGPAKK